MKKLITYIFFVIIFVFIIPAMFTQKFNFEVASSENVEKMEEYDYGVYNNVKVLMDNGEIKEIVLDEYLHGVLSAEMPASYEKEALKAQAIVARTYTMYKILKDKKHENCDICSNYACCQAWIDDNSKKEKWKDKYDEYNNKIKSAIDETKGKIITYENSPINALFHANSGGKTEIPINVWGGNYPYFAVVETSGENEYSGYASEIEISKEEFINKIKEKYNDFEIDFLNENCIKILEYTESGRVKMIRIGNKEISGVELRSILSLKSSNFVYEILENTIKFKVIGYGHGVGLSQSGSDALARSGKNSDEIINHYYKNIEIINY